jgi:protein-S-isoprenylcysteine O-methyltransferase Ste14
VVGIVIVVVGFGLSAASILQFVRHGTHPDPSKPSTTLITTGPYRYSRNPIYLAYSLMHFGIALWAAKAWLLITLLLAVALIQFGVVVREEEYLGRRFGESYLQYKGSVRRWLSLGSGKQGAGSGTSRPEGQ